MTQTKNSVVVTVGLYGSLMITLLVPSGGLVTVVVLANDSDQNSVVVTVGLYGSLDNDLRFVYRQVG